MKSALALVATLLLASCGGGSESDQYQNAINLANAKEQEARALADPSPCDENAQCGTLAFKAPAACGTYSYKPYSLVSPTAEAASAAASEQEKLAEEALSQAPNAHERVCIASIEPVPVVACVSNKCQVTP